MTGTLDRAAGALLWPLRVVFAFLLGWFCCAFYVAGGWAQLCQGLGW